RHTLKPPLYIACYSVAPPSSDNTRDSKSLTLSTKSVANPFAKLSRLTTFTTSPATAGSIVNPISSVCSPKVTLLCATVPPSLHTTHVPVSISLSASTSQILTPSFKSTSV